MDRNICCIILNYNDAKTTGELVNELSESQCISEILLVDNHSKEESYEELREIRRNAKKVPVHLIRTGNNRGYGCGNQVGIHYAAEHFQPDYIMIANPDIHVSDVCIERLVTALEEEENAAVASAMVKSTEGKDLFSYWDLLPLGKDLLDTGLVSRRVLKPMLLTSMEKLPRGEREEHRFVGALPGSMFLLNMKYFQTEEERRIFDPKIFLYYEEKILGRKLSERGLKEVLVTDASYVHAHSVSINKSFSGIIEKQKILHRSKMHYYKHYLKAGKISLAFAKLYLDGVIGEIWFLTRVLGMRW